MEAVNDALRYVGQAKKLLNEIPAGQILTQQEIRELLEKAEEALVKRK